MTNVIEIDEDYEYRECEASIDNNIVERVTSSISYNDYFRHYLRHNIPCVIQRATDSWPCRRKWIADGAPNFEYLKTTFGSSVVPVADCSTKYYNSQMKKDMTMNDYIDYWVSCRDTVNCAGRPLLYLKDWHCMKDHSHIPIYQIPSYFGSDWLNEYYSENGELDDDYMFVYMGPKGTWTPFHADVLSSYSWSANIVGKKRWLLFKPREEDRFRDKYGQLIYDVTADELSDKTLYPNYNEESLRCYEIVQEPGEIVFVPSGWHHQVWNLEDTISINHNWINACNVWKVWAALKKEFLAVMREVDDCREMDDWDEHCQVMLKASHGINYKQFYDFLSFVSQKRITFIKNHTPAISFGKWHLGRNHCLYDLKQIKLVLDDMINDSKAKCIDSLIFSGDNVKFLVHEIGQLLYEN